MHCKDTAREEAVAESNLHRPPPQRSKEQNTKEARHAAMTRSSAAVEEAKKDAKSAGVDVRYSTIKLPMTGRRGVLRDDARAMLPHFCRYARVRGVGSHVVSVVANSMLIDEPDLQSTVTNVQLFFTQVWSSVDRYFTGRKDSRDKFGAYVRAFFVRNPLGDECARLLSDPVPVMTRQQDCAALAVATIAHLRSFETRLRKHLRAALVSIQISTGDGKLHPKEAEAAKLVGNAVLAGEGEAADSARVRLESFLQNEFASEDGSREEGARALVRNERTALGDLLRCYVYEKGPDKVPTMSTRSRLSAIKASVDMANKFAHLLLPQMVRVSNADLALMHTHDLLPASDRVCEAEESDSNATDGDVDIECDDQEERDREKEGEGDGKTPWRKNRRPKPFTVLPISKLRPAMAYYGPTELENMYSAVQKQAGGVSGKKRKDRETADDDEHGHDATASQCDLGTELFDFTKVKGKTKVGKSGPEGRRWRLACFRTNGYVVSLTFVSGSSDTVQAPHVADLVDAGYKIPIPDQKVTRETPRGLFRISAERNDLAADHEWRENDSVAIVDPGLLRPVQVGTTTASFLNGVRTGGQIACAANLWHVNNAEWMQGSGRMRQQEVEEKRRRKNESYGASLDALSQTRRKCTDATLFAEFARVAMATLDARTEELMAESRVLFRWKCSKTLESFLSRVADRIADRTSTRLSRQPTGEKDHVASSLTTEERESLREKLRAEKARRFRGGGGRMRTVFFGDGTFSTRGAGAAKEAGPPACGSDGDGSARRVSDVDDVPTLAGERTSW